MSEGQKFERHKPSINEVIHIKLFPRGVRELCKEGWKEEFEWWVDKLRERLTTICDQGESEQSGEDEGHYYCQWEQVPNRPRCFREVCYNELGQVMWEGPIICR